MATKSGVVPTSHLNKRGLDFCGSGKQRVRESFPHGIPVTAASINTLSSLFGASYIYKFVSRGVLQTEQEKEQFRDQLNKVFWTNPKPEAVTKARARRAEALVRKKKKLNQIAKEKTKLRKELAVERAKVKERERKLRQELMTIYRNRKTKQRQLDRLSNREFHISHYSKLPQIPQGKYDTDQQFRYRREACLKILKKAYGEYSK